MRRRVWRTGGKGLLKGISETFGTGIVDDGMDSFWNEIELLEQNLPKIID